MGLSGFLYVAIVVGWAVYLVPFALKRYDEATRNRSIDRFSSAMRVLGRRDGDDDGVVARSSTFEMASSRTGTPAAAARRTATREAAKVAARRRRRVLLTLLFLTAATAGAAGLAFVDWWAVGVPGGLVVGWLVVCRLQARRERMAEVRPREQRAEPAPAPDPAVAEPRIESGARGMPEVVVPVADDEP
ncbi:MAG: divisome protein SepX/GlpR, partial [Nocardioidaceae bacterium]